MLLRFKTSEDPTMSDHQIMIGRTLCRNFAHHWVPATHLFNFDESPIKDDPGSEDSFLADGQKYYEQVMNHSKVGYSIMFCCSAAGQMLPPLVVYKRGTGSVYASWCEDRRHLCCQQVWMVQYEQIQSVVRTGMFF